MLHEYFCAQRGTGRAKLHTIYTTYHDVIKGMSSGTSFVDSLAALSRMGIFPGSKTQRELFLIYESNFGVKKGGENEN